MKQALFSYSIAILFMLLFIYTAACELLYYAEFVQGLVQLPLVGHFASEMAWVMPAVEWSIAVMLFNHRWRFAGLFASFSLILLFTWYGIIITFFTDGISCCGETVFDDFTWRRYLAFNSSCVLLLSLAVLFYQPIFSTGLDYDIPVQYLPPHSL